MSTFGSVGTAFQNQGEDLDAIPEPCTFFVILTIILQLSHNFTKLMWLEKKFSTISHAVSMLKNGVKQSKLPHISSLLKCRTECTCQQNRDELCQPQIVHIWLSSQSVSAPKRSRCNSGTLHIQLIWLKNILSNYFSCIFIVKNKIKLCKYFHLSMLFKFRMELICQQTKASYVCLGVSWVDSVVRVSLRHREDQGSILGPCTFSLIT